MTGAPLATYRLQFTPTFRFAEARRILPYLRELGISHIYASPITRARRGSTHGYDVCDPLAVNSELGTREELIALLTAARGAGMGWLQDVVPNHLAASTENPYWYDTLQHGRGSRWARIFDIDWEHPDLDGRIQLPVLGEPYGACLEQGKLTVVPAAGGPQIAYGGLRLPLEPSSVAALLAEREGCRGLADALAGAVRHADPERRDRELEAAWRRIGASDVRSAYEAACTGLAGAELDRLIQRQPWRLAWWRTGREVVGYRRFFAIDDLAAVRIEEEAAFALMHGLAFELADLGLIAGVRIDHIDGLRDPDAYLRDLRRRLPGAWILVEKILAADEALPGRWPIDGTTGYEFLAGALAACCRPGSGDDLGRLHRRLTAADEDPERLKIRLREDVDRLGLAGDVERVARCVRRAHGDEPAVRDTGVRRLGAGIAAIAARFATYRTYGTADDGPVLEAACARAAADRPDLAPAIAAIRGVLARGLDPAAPPAVREALLRFQQLTGPVMAKGCEDTFFYAYTRWIGLNEVGGDPLAPARSPAGFIAFAGERGAAWPLGLNATATHDTKRGEDTRARLAALTWLPAEWEDFAADRVRPAPGAPHADDQYALLQTLAATWPAPGAVADDHLDRLLACARKSVREAGVRSSWSDPDDAYEERVAGWLRESCGSADFQRGIGSLVRLLAPIADAVGLAMTVLKCTLPGVPDIYQGCEWPDHSLVDPDNRRPVDFAAREAGLASIAGSVPPIGDPRRKQAVLQRCLRIRSRGIDGPVEPLEVAGDADGLFAFRRGRGEGAIVVLADVRGGGRGAIEAEPLAEGCAWHDALTGTVHPPGRLPIASLLRHLPCALLVAVRSATAR